MSYSISFKAKVQDKPIYLEIGFCGANVTWNVRDMITNSTGLEWENESNNGYCKDVIPKIRQGLEELIDNREQYKRYESPNGWGTISETVRFFRDIIDAWESLLAEDEDLAEAALFWIS